MREIKFRGRKSNGEWIYGDLVTTETTDGHPSKKDISPFDTVLEDTEEVEENTIGQFTGLHDKNGKEIYEGDILRGFEYPFYDAEADAYNYYAVVDWDADEAQFYAYKDLARGAQVRGISCGVCVDMEDLREMEVLGNIHDNPELLNK